MVLDMFLTVFMWVLVIRVLLSWVNPDPYNPIVRMLYRTTDPLLNWIKRRLPLSTGGLDFSPIIVIAAIVFLQQFLVPVLVRFSYRFL
jgi:YggT family protein